MISKFLGKLKSVLFKSTVSSETPLKKEKKTPKTAKSKKAKTVNSKKNLRLKRFLKRGKSKKIFNILDKRQLPPAKKIKFCDYVINNNGTLNKLKRQIKSIKNKL